ncbi:MAG: cytochrome c family protein [Actinobacteria bacterium]|nr:cytochrome c family protein [Actinomycetota bacterium]MCL5883192.1 cytochrome c family protein [Actinomycetota bacterium]
MRRMPLAAGIFSAMAVLLLAGISTSALMAKAPFKTTEFTPSSTCGTCHDDIYTQWQGSMHNNSLTDPFFVGMQGQASTESASAGYCVGCHTPFGSDSGEVPPTTGPQISAITREGIQCDFCHTLRSTDAYGPSQIKYGPFTDSVSTFHATAYFALQTRSEFCGLCHDQVNPDNQQPVQATFTEWKNSGYAAQGVQCQDCHMTPGPGVTEPNPGRAANDGPLRPNIFTHYFTGGNATQLASEEHQKLATQNLEAAATVRMDPAGPAQLQVKVDNKGAGHYLPTGVTEIREMWLEIEVTDWAGNPVFHSGGIDANGAVDPSAVRYGTIYKTANGQPTVKAWQAAGVLSDHRVPPQASLVDVVQAQLPPDAPRPLVAWVTVHYRTATQAQINESMGSGAIQVPVIDMTGDCLFID